MLKNNNEIAIVLCGHGSSFNLYIQDFKKTHKKIQSLVNEIKKVIKKAINEGGSSIKNFNNTEGEKGNFQQFFNVYGRQGKSCTQSNCKGTVKKIKLSNRSTFFCNICQK